MLSRPHLMLADLGGDDRIAIAGQLPQPFDRALGHDLGVGRGEGERVARAPAIDTTAPLAQIGYLVAALLPERDHVGDRAAHIGDDWQVHADILVDRRAIDIDVDLPGIWGESV